MKFAKLATLIIPLFVLSICACTPNKRPPDAASNAVDPAQQEMLNKARAALDGGDFNLARTQAADFIGKYPSSELAAEAQYIVAQSYLRESREEDARREFAKLVQNYPNGTRSSEAANALHTLEERRLEQIAAINAEQRRIAVEHDHKISETVRDMRITAAKERLYIVLDLNHYVIMLKQGDATLYAFPCAVGKGYGYLATTGQTQEFETPVGKRKVVKKEKDPIWVRPDWHWLEMGMEVPEGMSPTDRSVAGHLGKYRLDLGDGIGIHGYAGVISPGKITHGCIRVNADDLEILFNLVEVGTDVYIF